MKETLGFSWWPLQSPPRPPLAMAAGRGRRGEKHGQNQGRKSCLFDGKTCLGHFLGDTLQGRDTYPTKREVRKRIDSKVPFDGIW